MTLKFEPIELDRQTRYLELTALCPAMASDYSFINIWAWAEEYGLLWAWTNDLIWIKQTRPQEVMWAPVGRWKGQDWRQVFDNYFNDTTIFIRVPETLTNLWKTSGLESLFIQEARGHWDYLYDFNDLVALEGNRFHKKKNLLNQFRKKYDFEFAAFDDNLIRLAMDMQESWCIWRDCEAEETLAQENRAIQKVLKNWNRLERIVGGAILVDEKIAAYSIGERLDENSLVIHFEKGDPDFKGGYQAINQMFLEYVHTLPGYEGLARVNREQDLDNEGLRNAKLSYNPTGFFKKFEVRVKGV